MTEHAVALQVEKPVVLVAAAAVFDRDDRVLLAQRPPGKSLAGYWEFPGGKLEPGETPEAALVRELKEELDIEACLECFQPFSFASHSYPDFHLLMPLFICRRWEGLAKPLEGQVLKWLKISQLRSYKLPPADLPLVAMLEDYA